MINNNWNVNKSYKGYEGKLSRPSLYKTQEFRSPVQVILIAECSESFKTAQENRDSIIRSCLYESKPED